MDIGTFIETTIDGIIEAATGLQKKHGGTGAVISPPQSFNAGGIYDPTDSIAQQRVQLVSFDIALTVGAETSGGGGVKVAGIGGEGSHKRTSEDTSRVQFELAVALPKGAETPPRKAPPKQTTRRRV